MSKAYQAAKEKYQAVLDDAGRGDYYCRTNRVGAGRHTSSIESNKVDHLERRRSSAASGPPPRPPTMRERIKSWMNRPAY